MEEANTHTGCSVSKNEEGTGSAMSRGSDWLRAGRQRGRSSSPGGVKNILYSTSSRPALGSTHPPV
jgi:hypothetical protein